MLHFYACGIWEGISTYPVVPAGQANILLGKHMHTDIWMHQQAEPA